MMGLRLRLALVLLLLVAAALPVADAAELPLSVERNDALPDLDAWHFRTAIPMPSGALAPGAPVALFDAKRKPVPCQFTVLATWHPSDTGKEAPPELIKRSGVRWLGLDFTAPLAPGARQFTLRYGDLPKDWQAPQPAHPLKVEDTPDLITVDNGLIRFRVRKRGFNFLDGVWANGKEVIAPGSGRGAYSFKEDGTECWSSYDPAAKVIVEESGPMLTVIRAEGWHRSEGQDPKEKGFCKFVVRIYAYADAPYVKVQHTWINTEDTDATRFGAFGLFVPGEGAAGELQPAQGESFSYLVKDWEHFQFLRMTGDRVERMAAGGEAGRGAFRRGAIGIAIRDFVQNYPKEVEFAKPGTWLHFWPRHGEDSARVITNGNLWRMWFAHEGRLLTFKVPETYNTAELRPNVMFQGNGFLANGMGTAKTHEMLMVFGPAAAGIDGYLKAFEEVPNVVAGGEWNCRTGAVGNVMWEDRKAFPLIEKMFHDRHEAYVDWRARNHDWGMWTYGDTHTHYWINAPTYYRMMQATHYAPPTAAWELYFRSGRNTYRKQARINGQHLIDVDHCHYVSPEYNRTPRNFSNRKEVGGITGYYGYAHWHHGAGCGFDSVLDYMWYDYYVNGNLRARDVALEHGGLVYRANRATAERNGAAIQNVLMDMYMATWDRKYWDRFRKNISIVTRYHPKTGIAASLDWQPWWRKYLRLARDPVVEAFMLRWADQVAPRNGGGITQLVDIVAGAYSLTQDPYYLAQVQRRLKNIAFGYYDPKRVDDAWYTRQGGGGGAQPFVGYRLGWLFNVHRLPYAMRALHDAPVKPFLGPADFSGGAFDRATRGADGPRLIVILHSPDGRPMELVGRLVTMAASWYSVLGPDGKARLLVRELPIGDLGATPVYPVPADGQPGFYAVCFGSLRTIGFHYGPPRAPERYGVVVGDGPLELSGAHHLFVPKGTTRFAIGYRGPWNSAFRGTFNLMAPSGEVRHRANLSPNEDGVIEILPRPDETGASWLITGGRYQVTRVEGVLPILSPGRSFLLDQDRLDEYMKMLRTVHLPALVEKEKAEVSRRLAEDRARFRNPKLNGQARVLHYQQRIPYNKLYGRLPGHLATLQTLRWKGEYLEWNTRPVPAEAMKKETYAFEWLADTSAKAASGAPVFNFSVNGEDVVSFSPVGENASWKGRRGASLSFEMHSRLVHGAQGRYRLTVPTALLKSGQPAVLRVYAPDGTDETIWFGLFEALVRK